MKDSKITKEMLDEAIEVAEAHGKIPALTETGFERGTDRRSY